MLLVVPEFRWWKTFLRQGPGVRHSWRAAVRAGRLPVRAPLPGRPYGGRYWEGAGGSPPREEGGRVSSPLRQAACRQQKVRYPVMPGFTQCSGSVGPGSFLTSWIRIRNCYARIRILQSISVADPDPVSSINQCCGSGSGIRRFFYPWIREGKNIWIREPGWTSQIIFPRA